MKAYRSGLMMFGASVVLAMSPLMVLAQAGGTGSAGGTTGGSSGGSSGGVSSGGSGRG